MDSVHKICKNVVLYQKGNFPFLTLSSSLVWAGALCVGVSRAAGAFAAGRRRSPRLVALLGGLLLPLACLFTSFATQLHQTLLSYGKCVPV